MEAKFYLVGGAVRDKIMGVKSKDMDFTVVAESYDAMRDAILERGSTIYLEQEQFLTIRAKMPFAGQKVDADFVLARKESDSDYDDGRRPNSVVIGTLFDDLSRRDFTMNAMAEDEDGTIIDPHGGQFDITSGVLRTVGPAEVRFAADRLRILRAIRFAVTKNMIMSGDIIDSINNNSSLTGVSAERIADEVNKMMKFNRVATIAYLFKLFESLGCEVMKYIGLEATLKPDYTH